MDVGGVLQNNKFRLLTNVDGALSANSASSVHLVFTQKPRSDGQAQ